MNFRTADSRVLYGTVNEFATSGPGGSIRFSILYAIDGAIDELIVAKLAIDNSAAIKSDVLDFAVLVVLSTVLDAFGC